MIILLNIKHILHHSVPFYLTLNVLNSFYDVPWRWHSAGKMEKATGFEHDNAGATLEERYICILLITHFYQNTEVSNTVTTHPELGRTIPKYRVQVPVLGWMTLRQHLSLIPGSTTPWLPKAQEWHQTLPGAGNWGRAYPPFAMWSHLCSSSSPEAHP